MSRSSELDHTTTRRHGQAEAGGHWTEKDLRITQRCPLAGLKADLVANQGSVREKAILRNGRTRVLPPKGSERRFKRSLWLDVEHPRETNNIADEEAWHECQL